MATKLFSVVQFYTVQTIVFTLTFLVSKYFDMIELPRDLQFLLARIKFSFLSEQYTTTHARLYALSSR